MLSEEQNPNFKFKLGIKLRDVISGESGTVVCRSQYLTGCNHYLLQRPGVDKDGKLWEWLSINEDQLVEVVVEEPVKVAKSERRGGPPFQEPRPVF